MFNRKRKYKTKLAKEISATLFCAFGIRANDHFDMIDILKHIKTLSNYSEVESELNKLADYIYDGKRKIFFHEFRQFPYIIHGKENAADMSGFAKNYTDSDIYLIKFIKKFLTYRNGEYSFFDVDFIIENTNKIKFVECSICDMPIDEILK